MFVSFVSTGTDYHVMDRAGFARLVRQKIDSVICLFIVKDIFSFLDLNYYWPKVEILFYFLYS